MKEKQKIIDRLEPENDIIKERLAQAEETIQNMIKEMKKKTEQVDILQDLVEKAEKDVKTEKEAREDLERRLKEADAKVRQVSALETDKIRQLEAMRSKNEKMDELVQKMTKEHQDEATRVKKSFDAKQKECENERDNYKKMYEDLLQEFEKYKEEQQIRDLLVVKFDIDAIDDELLTAKETKIEDLEKQKVQLEVKIQDVLKDMNLHISNEKELSEKVQKFQSKCSQLEKLVSQTEEDTRNDIKRLAREKALAEDKLEVLQKSF